jgi:hypothetical protein
MSPSSEKSTVTLLSPSIVTTQPPEPAQSPPQPLKLAVAMGCAESVTTVPLGNVADAIAQSSPQLMPAGELVTPPRMRPSGVLVMLSLNGEGEGEVRARVRRG